MPKPIKKPSNFTLNWLRQCKIDPIEGRVYRGGKELGSLRDNGATYIQTPLTAVNRKYVIWWDQMGYWPEFEIWYKDFSIDQRDAYANLMEL